MNVGGQDAAERGTRGVRWKRVFLALLVAWLAIAHLVYFLGPGRPTGSRLLDAVLLASMATVALLLIGELLEVAWGFLGILFGRRPDDRARP